VGGAVSMSAALYHKIPAYFLRMAYCECLFPAILDSFQNRFAVVISPIAKTQQLEYNSRAHKLHVSNFDAGILHHVSQVLYSMVADPFGSHKDVTVKGGAELI
jgi:hypothetical protein